MLEQFSKLENGWDFIYLLLDVTCLISMQNVHMAMWLQENVAKRLPFFFGSKIYLWMRKYNIVVIFSALILKAK